METQATYNPPPPASRSTEQHDQHMLLLWQRLGQMFGQEAWQAKNGPADGRKFEDWVKVLRAQGNGAIAKALGKCPGLTEPPSLLQFVKLCGDQPAQQPAAKTSDHSIRDREIARQQQLATSSKSRQSNQVETFMAAYHNCGLGSRWPGGEVVL